MWLASATSDRRSVTRVSVSDGRIPFVFPVHDPDGAALKLIGDTAQILAFLFALD